jgi:hypothetical protein
MLRLNTAIEPAAEPNRLGVLADDNAGFPNGRRLTDDVVDMELQALEGAIITGEIVEPLAAGDGVDSNDLDFADAFPYVALPHSGSGAASAGLGGGDGGNAEPSPAATDDGDDTDVSTSPVGDESDGVSTAVLIGAALVALLIGLAVGVLVSRKRSTSAA